MLKGIIGNQINHAWKHALGVAIYRHGKNRVNGKGFQVTMPIAKQGIVESMVSPEFIS